MKQQENKTLKPCPFCGVELKWQGTIWQHLNNRNCLTAVVTVIDTKQWNTRPGEDAAFNQGVAAVIKGIRKAQAALEIISSNKEWPQGSVGEALYDEAKFIRDRDIDIAEGVKRK